MSTYVAFPRPMTHLNRCVALIVGRWPARHTISEDDLNRWFESSMLACADGVSHPHDVLAAIESADWSISHATDYDSNTWSLEVLFNDRQRPQVHVFTQAIWTRLPLPRWLFEYLGETAVDHAIGHLYAFQRGVTPDENVACYIQYRAARARNGWDYQVMAFLVRVLHRFHKHIPWSNYESVRHAQL